MFNLAELEDTIPLSPNSFNIDRAITLKDALNRKFSNRLIPNVGLGLAVYDILTCGEGKVIHSDGLVWYKLTFRLVVFSPFQGEVLLGQVLSNTPEYIRVSVGFFTDVYIPAKALPPSSAYDEEERQHFWRPADEEDMTPPEESPKEERFYISTGDVIRFRVESLEWQEVEPLPPSVRNKPPPLDAEGNPIEPTPEEVEMKERLRESEAGLRVMASIGEQGLGLVDWWQQ